VDRCSWGVLPMSRLLIRSLTFPLVAALLGAAGVFPAVALAAPGCAGLPATIVGTAGDDVIHGTPGNDVIVGLDGADTIYGYGGDDVICGGKKDDTIYGGAGDDLLQGGRGRDHFVPGVGADTVRGGAWIDTIDYRDSTRRVDVDLRAGSAKGQGVDTISDIEIVIGSEYDDRIQLGDTTSASRWRGFEARGRGGDDVILAGLLAVTVWPGPGDDIVVGGPGSDRVEPSPGDDIIRGGPGGDWLYGGRGTDIIYGGPGDDALFGDIYGQPYVSSTYGGRGDDSCEMSKVRVSCERDNSYRGGIE
jgi:Ca2+-binding RTX toxin-like protein